MAGEASSQCELQDPRKPLEVKDTSTRHEVSMDKNAFTPVGDKSPAIVEITPSIVETTPVIMKTSPMTTETTIVTGEKSAAIIEAIPVIAEATPTNGETCTAIIESYSETGETSSLTSAIVDTPPAIVEIPGENTEIFPIIITDNLSIVTSDVATPGSTVTIPSTSVISPKTPVTVPPTTIPIASTTSTTPPTAVTPKSTTFTAPQTQDTILPATLTNPQNTFTNSLTTVTNLPTTDTNPPTTGTNPPTTGTNPPSTGTTPSPTDADLSDTTTLPSETVTPIPTTTMPLLSIEAIYSSTELPTPQTTIGPINTSNPMWNVFLDTDCSSATNFFSLPISSKSEVRAPKPWIPNRGSTFRKVTFNCTKKTPPPKVEVPPKDVTFPFASDAYPFDRDDLAEKDLDLKIKKNIRVWRESQPDWEEIKAIVSNDLQDEDEVSSYNAVVTHDKVTEL